jgi:type IV pilus assembly protein PilY1
MKFERKGCSQIIRKSAAASLALIGLLFAPLSANAATNIANTPLYLGGSVPPNIMYIFDDSKSMQFSFVPDSIKDDYNTKRAKSSHYNTLYYNPNVTYEPPRDQNGASLGNASFTSAKPNGYDSSSTGVDLSQDYRPFWNSYSQTYADTGSSDATQAYYYVYDDTIVGCTKVATDDNCYSKVSVSSSSGPGGTDERVNFANWYSYYHSRVLTAKTGSSLAFSLLNTAPRVGYGRLNQGSTTSVDGIAGLNLTTINRGVRPFIDYSPGDSTATDNYRKAFFDWLQGLSPSSYTPTRRALDAAGQYFSSKNEKGPYSTTPGVSGGQLLSCRHNYTVLMTDGYWNKDQAATAAARADNDHTSGPTVNGTENRSYTYTAESPFTDTAANVTTYDNTLADVAMYYWKNDLATGTSFDNNVPTSPADPAFWQHMVTIGVGLGVPTQVDPDTAFNAINTHADIDWPDPDVGNTDYLNPPATRADDLLHAAVNSRGGFFNAQTPDAFAQAMADSLNIVGSRTSSASAIATNSTRLDANTYIYQAKYDSSDWSGRLIAYAINADGSVGSQKWDGALTIPAADSRSIYTYDGSAGANFLWADISSSQQTALGSENILNYIRGDSSLELKNGGSYRNRSYLLGDIVNSDPWFVGTANYGYSVLDGTEGDSYNDFLALDSYKDRTKAVYVGSNDGMLHAFNAYDGAELFSYVPASVYSNLPALANANYTHQYYVDGSPRAGDAYIDIGTGKEWRTVLVGSTGAGGKSVYALDVTYPSSFSASDVLWEYTNSELGYTIGQPTIVRLHNGAWGAVFGNGYNSTSQTARIFIVNVETGALIKELDTEVGDATTPNGMATPIVADTDGDRIADVIYAGDLLGNLWRFDITNANPSQWASPYKSGNKPDPLFTATGPAGEVQPITGKPQVKGASDGGVMIYFGTGQYFEVGDNIVPKPPATTPAVMSIYGIHDNGSQVARGDLLQQEIFYEDSGTFTNATTGLSYDWDLRLLTQKALTTQLGWYIDLISPPPADLGKEGERVVAAPVVWNDRVIFTTLIPNTDPCAWGGTSWLMEVDPDTGGRLNFSVFDLNKDGSFNDSEFVTVTDPNDSTKTITIPVSGKKSKEGIVKTPGVICADAACYKYSSGSSGNVEVTANKGTVNSGRQSWQQLK